MRHQSLTLLCLSHLNWDHVWQRPQQLMSRFARHCQVIYVDPPEVVADAKVPTFHERQSGAAVRLIHPVFPEHLVAGSHERYESLWRSLLPTVLDLAGDDTILWVFSPLADYLVAEARDRTKLAVYDCMDDLASFRDGTDAMRTRERHLMAAVDLVFTGGRSMYESRKGLHPRVFCFPSGVDLAHYQQTQCANLALAAPVTDIPQPRLGYFGVLDERIDWPLIAAIAERQPDWHWVLVGPAVKVERSELPTAPNIHYLGQQAYHDLPAFLKSFDLATMPFALNAATRFISPTKTLEYLAGGKDVISSSVPDVVATYEGVVTIVDGVDAWSAAIDQLLAASPAERAARLERAQPLLEAGSWDGIVDQMWGLMQAQA